MGSWLRGAVRGAVKVGGTALKSPIGKTALSFLGPAGAAISIGSALIPSGGGRSNLPALPGLPGLPMGTANTVGKRTIFGNDPNLPAMLQGYAISKANLRQYYRAPKGFVVLKDEAGDAYGLPKFLAKQMGMWKPAKKPLLSIKDTNAIKHAGSAIKKLQKAEKMAKKIANWHSPRPKAAPSGKKGK